jgi:hypothetical protein
MAPCGNRKACGSVFRRDLDVERVEFAVVVVVVVVVMMMMIAQTCRRAEVAYLLDHNFTTGRLVTGMYDNDYSELESCIQQPSGADLLPLLDKSQHGVHVLRTI